MFLEDADTNLVNARDVKRIIVRPDGNGFDRAFAVMRGGREVLLADDAEGLNADMDRVLPAQPGFYVATIEELDAKDVRFSFSVAPVVAWRIENQAAVPILAGEIVDLDQQNAIIDPDGNVTEYRHGVWGRVGPWRGSFAAWITRAGSIIARSRRNASLAQINEAAE